VRIHAGELTRSAAPAAIFDPAEAAEPRKLGDQAFCSSGRKRRFENGFENAIREALADFDGTMMLRLSRSHRAARALEPGARDRGPDGPRQYGGGYADYVTETGYEAPGVR
jgi:hypothetical protein